MENIKNTILVSCSIELTRAFMSQVIQILIASNKTQRSDHLQVKIEMDPTCENQNDGKRLQAALLSTIAAIHCKGLIKGEISHM
jgi:phenylacetate-coenzyme A ligase PaaK-like adenylate-forming protein